MERSRPTGLGDDAILPLALDSLVVEGVTLMKASTVHGAGHGFAEPLTHTHTHPVETPPYTVHPVTRW